MKARSVLALVGAVTVVVAGAGVAAWWMLRPPSIEDAAQSYVQALHTGDVGAVDALLPTSMTDPQRTRIEDAFSGASSRIASPHIEAIGDDGSVRATARLAGKKVTIRFALAREGGSYRLTGDFLAAVTITPSLGDAVRVGTTTIDAGDEAALLPAEYPVTALPDDILTGTTTVAVSNDAPVTAALEVSFSPDAVTVAGAQLAAYEDACTTPADAVPPHCGLRVPWAADLRELDSLAFRIDERPTLALADDGDTFAATGGRITATARGTGWNGASRSVTYTTDDWALRGRIGFDGPTMTLHVD